MGETLLHHRWLSEKDLKVVLYYQSVGNVVRRNLTTLTPLAAAPPDNSIQPATVLLLVHAMLELTEIKCFQPGTLTSTTQPPPRGGTKQ